MSKTIYQNAAKPLIILARILTISSFIIAYLAIMHTEHLTTSVGFICLVGAYAAFAIAYQSCLQSYCDKLTLGLDIRPWSFTFLSLVSMLSLIIIIIAITSKAAFVGLLFISVATYATTSIVLSKHLAEKFTTPWQEHKICRKKEEIQKFFDNQLQEFPELQEKYASDLSEAKMSKSIQQVCAKEAIIASAWRSAHIKKNDNYSQRL
ncbi:MAG: hypothetical protein ACI9TY_001449 [Alphaproteobacteria bacterium]|jgi:hypothetical protein